MDRFINNLRVLWRANSAIADIRLRQALARSGINAVAALVAVFGLLMLELAAYFALLEVLGLIASAIALGLINFAVAGVLFLIASHQKPGRELELANEIHNSAIQALQADASRLQSEWAAFGNAVRHPMDSALGALPGLIVPLASVLLSTLKKQKKDAN